MLIVQVKCISFCLCLLGFEPTSCFSSLFNPICNVSLTIHSADLMNFMNKFFLILRLDGSSSEASSQRGHHHQGRPQCCETQTCQQWWHHRTCGEKPKLTWGYVRLWQQIRTFSSVVLSLESQWDHLMGSLFLWVQYLRYDGGSQSSRLKAIGVYMRPKSI